MAPFSFTNECFFAITSHFKNKQILMVPGCSLEPSMAVRVLLNNAAVTSFMDAPVVITSQTDEVLEYEITFHNRSIK